MIPLNFSCFIFIFSSCNSQMVVSSRDRARAAKCGKSDNLVLDLHDKVFNT